MSKAFIHPRAKRLKIVLELAENDMQQALEYWGEFQKRLQTHQQQAQQLEQYQQEYQQRLAQPSERQVNGGLLHQQLHFIQQVNESLRQQQGRVLELNEQVQQARDRYLSLQAKVKGLTDVIERLNQQALQDQQRQQQRESDEWSVRQYRTSQ